jgi:allophanate hydrolase
VEVDLTPFLETAELLYGGPWVAERTAAIESFLRKRPEALHPVTRTIIEGGFQQGAVDTFNSWYRLQELRRTVEPVWDRIDFLLTPTVPAHYTLAEVEADPVATNSHLGLYTNWMNLLDLCAVAVPAGKTGRGLPFGVTLQAPALQDEALLGLAGQFLGEEEADAGPPPGWVTVAVCGAHLEGLPLNGQLTERGSVLRKRTRSAPCYKFIALPGNIAKPGMIRVAEGGASIEVELWDMPVEHFGSFTALIPPPLGIGSVQLEDGSWVKGFSCEAIAAETATDITSFGSWRAYVQSCEPG